MEAAVASAAAPTLAAAATSTAPATVTKAPSSRRLPLLSAAALLVLAVTFFLFSSSSSSLATTLQGHSPAAHHPFSSDFCRKHFISPEKLDRFKALAKAQTQEDLHALSAYSVVSHKLGGTILESGALDGLRFSTSYAFAEALGWTAIHVEAAPNNYAALQKNRPARPANAAAGKGATININAALCKERQTVHFVDNRAVGGIWEFMSTPFKQKWYPEELASNRMPDGGRTSELECGPLHELLESRGVKPHSFIDIWVLDVEGAELEVLQGLDFSRLSFGMIILEDSPPDTKKEAIKQLLGRQGYQLIEVRNRSAWYLKKELLQCR